MGRYRQFWEEGLECQGQLGQPAGPQKAWRQQPCIILSGMEVFSVLAATVAVPTYAAEFHYLVLANYTFVRIESE